MSTTITLSDSEGNVLLQKEVQHGPLPSAEVDEKTHDHADLLFDATWVRCDGCGISGWADLPAGVSVLPMRRAFHDIVRIAFIRRHRKCGSRFTETEALVR